MSQRSHEFSASFPLSDILGEDLQQEIFKQVGSQDINALLNGELPEEIIDDGSYRNEIYNNQVMIHEENTMSLEDIDIKHDNFMVEMAPQLLPLPTTEVMSNEEYVGPYEFEVLVLPNHKSKNPWVYSAPLNKIFMDMNQQFPVDFKIKNRRDKCLFIRTTPQYSAQHHASEAVCRCIQHDHHNDPTNKDVDENVRQHVIRCSNKYSQYVGDTKQNHRLSIVFPLSLPQVGNESVRELFHFVCKSSCPAPGMQRRGIEVIFTLEDEGGTIFGRKCLKVRICACPKRDKDKEESEAYKANNGTAPRGKKRKITNPPPASAGKVLPNADTSKFFQLNIQLFGKKNLAELMNYAEKMYFFDIHQHRGMPEEQHLKESLAEIQKVKRQLQ